MSNGRATRRVSCALCAGLAVAGALAVVPASSRADDAPAASKASAKEHFDRGVALLNKNEWDAALAEFVESRRLYVSKGNTKNAAICLRALGRRAEALEMFRAVMALTTAEDERIGIEKEMAELQRQVGALVVTVSEVDASVVVDGRERGRSPLPLPIVVDAGSHVVRAFKSGFMMVEKEVRVSGRDSLEVALVLSTLERSGRLVVSEVEGRAAEVFVDNVSLGKTPWQGSLALGDHSVFLRGEGDLGTQPAAANLRINEATPIVLALEPLTASLRVEPEPLGARIALDGVFVGRGSWSGHLRAGRHRVEVVEDGYVPQTRVVDLDDRETTKMAVPLERDLTSPVWASKNPNRVFVELALGLPFLWAAGGDVRAGCSGACSVELPWAGALGARIGYERGFGLGFALDLGLTTGNLSVSGRTAPVLVKGEEAIAHTANVDDRVRYRALSVGVSAHYRRGESIPVTVRLGAGLWTGAFSDVRTVRATGNDVTTSTSLGDEPSGTYVYIAPEIRVGRTFGVHTEVFVSLQGAVLLGTSVPTFSGDAFPYGRLGFARFAPERVLGSVAASAGPTVGVKYAF